MIIRQTIWRAIRDLRRFTVPQLVAEAETNRLTTTKYVRRLEAAGYVARAGRAARKNPSLCRAPIAEGSVRVVYELVRDIGAEAPRLDANGAVVRRGRAHDQMWRTMKIIGEFTCRELAFAASTESVRVTLKHARQYVHWLKKADYLATIIEGTSHRQAVYRLARNTGAQAPVIERLPAVFDPNLSKVVWQGAPA